MRLQLLTVRKPKQKALAEAGADYFKRLARYCKIEEHTVREERAGKGIRSSDVIRKEGERVLSSISPSAYVVILDRGGKAVASEQLAEKVAKLAERSIEVVFVIGGALGLSPDVIKRANWRWSLSAQTYPHELARVMVLEQLYRAHTLLRGEPYHK